MPNYPKTKSEAHKQAIGEAMAKKTWHVNMLYESGEQKVITINNLSQWCRDNGIIKNNLLRTLRTKWKVTDKTKTFRCWLSNAIPSKIPPIPSNIEKIPSKIPVISVTPNKISIPKVEIDENDDFIIDTKKIRNGVEDIREEYGYSYSDIKNDEKAIAEVYDWYEKTAWKQYWLDTKG